MKLFKHINNTAIYIRKQQLTLPIHSILEEYKPETLKTVIFGAQKLMKFEEGTHILEMESDNRSQWSNWQIETSRYGWNRLKQKEEDLVSTSYKLFYLSPGKGKQNNVIKKVRWVEQAERYLHLAKYNQQGQCIRWEEEVIEQKISWKEIWESKPATLSFLLKST